MFLMVSYLNGRYQCVKWQCSIFEETILNFGVTQGSVLGPILVIVNINDNSELVNMYSILYANLS